MSLSVMKLKIIYNGIFQMYTSFLLIVNSAVNFMYSFNLSVSWGAFQTNLGEHQPASAMVVYSPNRHTSHHRILADEASQELLRGQETCIVFRILICIGFINYFSKISPLKTLKKHLFIKYEFGKQFLNLIRNKWKLHRWKNCTKTCHKIGILIFSNSYRMKY